MISITDAGMKLKENVKIIPNELSKFINLTTEETIILYKLLYKIISSFK